MVLLVVREAQRRRGDCGAEERGEGGGVRTCVIFASAVASFCAAVYQRVEIHALMHLSPSYTPFFSTPSSHTSSCNTRLRHICFKYQETANYCLCDTVN